MTPNADIVRQLIIGASLGSDGGTWPVYTGFLTDDVDNAIAVYDTAGVKDGRLMATGEVINHPGVQVRVRGPVYADVLKKIQDIALELDTVKSTVVGIDPDVYRIFSITRVGDILPMGVETEGDRRRFNFTINVLLTITKL